MEAELFELKRRLARAERQTRTLLILFFAAIVAGVILTAARPATTQTVSTTVKAPFTVVDDQGRRLVEIGRGNGGDGSVTTFSHRGNFALTSLGSGDSGGQLHIYDEHNNMGAAVGVEDLGGVIGGSIFVGSSRGQSYATLSAPGDACELDIRGLGGRATVGVPHNPRIGFNSGPRHFGPALELQSQIDGTEVTLWPHPRYNGRYVFTDEANRNHTLGAVLAPSRPRPSTPRKAAPNGSLLSPERIGVRERWRSDHEHPFVRSPSPRSLGRLCGPL
jgi:hypothetical protein